MKLNTMLWVMLVVSLAVTGLNLYQNTRIQMELSRRISVLEKK